MTDDEHKIYDEYVTAMRAIIAKADADAKAIGSDIKNFIGPVANDVKKAETTAKKWFQVAWQWFWTVTQFLDSPMVNGVSKFSHKRLIAVAAAVIAIRQLVKNDPWGALG